MRPWLIPVGGFLGAGKTSLLMEAGGRLRERGHHVAILTNDQAGGLVDSAAARSMSFDAGEVAGACFCCAFTRFVEAAATLAHFALHAYAPVTRPKITLLPLADMSSRDDDDDQPPRDLMRIPF